MKITTTQEQNLRSSEVPSKEAQQNDQPRLTNLGKIAELTHGAGRQWVDGRKDSERQ